MIEIDGDGRLYHCKQFHGILHPVKGCRLPDKVHTEVMVDIDRDIYTVRL